MNEYIFKISSPFQCLLRVDKIEKVLSSPCDFLLLKVSDEKIFTIYCYPTQTEHQEQKNIPFIVNIKPNELKKSTTQQVEITTFKNNFIFLTLKPFLIPKALSLKTKKQTLSVLGKNLEANLSVGKPTIFSLFFESDIFYKTLKKPCSSFKATVKNNLIFIEFNSIPKYFLVIDCKNNNQVLDDCEIDTIEYSKDKICTK